MLIRVFNSPAGWDSYSFLHEFGTAVNDLGFLVSCVIIFDDAEVLALVKRAVIVATLVGIALNIYCLMHPDAFLVPGMGAISRRPAGLYMNANGSGAALVLGCIIGLTAMRPSWR